MSDASLENRYYSYLRARGHNSVDFLLSVLSHYLSFFEGFERVLDVGCGHGEFLRMLREAGHQPFGIDVDEAMVQACLEQGLDAQQVDALTWLPTQAGAWDAIFSSNVLEHLGPAEVAALIRASFTALRPGGMLLVAVPNPESITVHLHEFWRDPTHVRLYDRQLLEFFFADAGFMQVQSAENKAACWEGVDVLLAGNRASAAGAGPAGPGQLPAGLQADVPAPPAAPAPLLRGPRPGPQETLRGRLWYGFTSFVWRKLFGPYTDALEADLERVRRGQAALATAAADSLAAVATVRAESAANLAAARAESAANLAAVRAESAANLAENAATLERAFRYLHPSREVFVLGYKPVPTEEAMPERAVEAGEAADQAGAIETFAAAEEGK